MTIIERGDTVSVRGNVLDFNDDGSIKVELDGIHRVLVWFDPNKVAIARKRELQAGDVVTIAGASLYEHYKIVAKHDQYAWLHPDNIPAVYPDAPAGVLVPINRLIRV